MEKKRLMSRIVKLDVLKQAKDLIKFYLLKGDNTKSFFWR